jgi:hypothetical protein
MIVSYMKCIKIKENERAKKGKERMKNSDYKLHLAFFFLLPCVFYFSREEKLIDQVTLKYDPKGKRKKTNRNRHSKSPKHAYIIAASNSDSRGLPVLILAFKFFLIAYPTEKKFIFFESCM